MSQYQKQTGIAILQLCNGLIETFNRDWLRNAVGWRTAGTTNRTPTRAQLVCVLLACLIVSGGARRTLAATLAYEPLQAIAKAPATAPLILPLEPTTVQLLTHTADFTFEFGDASSDTDRFSLQLDATYRFENDSAEPAIVILKIPTSSATDALAQISLFADSSPLNLFQTEGVGYTTQLQIGADSRMMVTMNYRLDGLESALPLLLYSAANLTAWPGAPSIRTSVALPNLAGPESWLRIAPQNWRYVTDDSNTLTGVKWLYDAQIPSEPFVFELIHPYQYQQLQALAEQAGSDPTLYQAIGDQYRTLLDDTPLDALYVAVRERFYSQALAAYTTGIEQLTAAGRTGAELGEHYASLAALYRPQIADASGRVDIDYSAAMVNAAQNAMLYLPADSPRREELTRWIVDGLQLALADAQRTEAWTAALSLVEQLAALPSDLVDHAILEQTKESITVRQALQLLEEEHREAAFALAGTALTDIALLPPRELQTSFARWEISATVSPATIDIVVQPLTVADQREAALGSIEHLTAMIESAADPAITITWQPTEPLSNGQPTTVGAAQEQIAPIGLLLISAPSDSSFASLTTAMPVTPEWALLYALLRQLQPTIERGGGWLNRSTAIRVQLDFQGVAAEWQGAAENLEAQATALDGAAATRNTRDAAEAESALRERIQATNYRTAAQQWRKLTETSWLQLQLVAPVGLQSATRSWLMTPATPLSVAELEGNSGYLAAFMSIVILAVGFLLLISTLLWWLL